MINIEYEQEKPQKIIFIVPGVFIFASIFMIISGINKYGYSSTFVSKSLLPAVLLMLFVIVCFCVLLKQSINVSDEIKDLLKNGTRLPAQIIRTKTHTSVVRKADGNYFQKYSYIFVVKYVDPLSQEEIIVESIPTYTFYELKTQNCIVRVLDNKLIVEKADAIIHKAKWSNLDKILVIAFLAVIIGITLMVIIPILKTL